LNLTGNHITTAEDFEGHQTLEILELRGNKLQNLKGIKNIHSLRELYVADNSLSSFK
jgi:Leucine-rich repeat (LRR) protein